MHGTSTVQLHAWPPHDVVLASCGAHTFGSTVEGVVVNGSHPVVAPEELPEPPPDEPPPLEEPELPEPPELEEPPSPREAPGVVLPPHAAREKARADAPARTRQRSGQRMEES
jgi:hypothetical protein